MEVQIYEIHNERKELFTILQKCHFGMVFIISSIFGTLK